MSGQAQGFLLFRSSFHVQSFDRLCRAFSQATGGPTEFRCCRGIGWPDHFHSADALQWAMFGFFSGLLLYLPFAALIEGRLDCGPETALGFGRGTNIA